MRGLCCGLILIIAAGLTGLCGRAQEPAAGEANVIDGDSKTHKLTAVKFTTGTKRLAWLADPKGTTEDELKGPLVLELRESISAMPLAKGIVTLVPVASLESLKYDFEKDLVTLGVKGLSQPLTGPLFYPRVNVLTFSGTVDGKTVSFTGGVRGKSIVRGADFGDAKRVPRPKADITWNIQIVKTKADMPKVEDPTLTARNLKVLYSNPGGGEQRADGLTSRKGPPIVFDGNLKRFEMLANDLNTNFAAAEVEPSTGAERIVAIPLGSDEDKKAPTLIGLVGEVDAGWRVFPLHTIKTITPSKRKVE